MKQECHCMSLECFYISMFTFLHLQRPRLQHAGLGDKEPPAPSHPARPPGVYIEDCKTCADIDKFLCPMDFLKLFLTPCLIGMLCTYSYTHDYANTVGPQKPSLYQSWSNTYLKEFYHYYLGRLLLYTYHYTVTTRMTSASRWAAMRAILMFQ